MPARNRLTRVSERLGLDILSNPPHGLFTHRVDVVTLFPLKPVPTGAVPVSSSHNGASALQALQETRDGCGWVQPQQQMDVGRDDPDGEQLTPLLACDGRKKSLQKARDLAIDKCRPIPGGPAEVYIDAMTHLPKLPGSPPSHITRNTRVNSSLTPSSRFSDRIAEWRV